jgi:hypothetical protein
MTDVKLNQHQGENFEILIVEKRFIISNRRVLIWQMSADKYK